MKYIVIAVLSFLLGFLVRGMMKDSTETESVDASAVIEHSIEQVSKLVVTEGHYSQVFTRKNTDSYLWDLIQFQKKAVILGTVDADVSYDLRRLQYEVDERNKKIILKRLPEPDIDYSYNFQWYDIDQSRMNQFTKDDLNKIQDEAKAKVRAQIDVDKLKSDGHQRLLEELGRMWSGLIAISWEVVDESSSVPVLQTDRTEVTPQ